jgi:hypothetical protein
MTSSGLSTYAALDNGRDNEMSLALARRLTTVAGVPERLGMDQEEARLNVVVISTSVDATIAALKRAGRLAESPGAQITLVVPQVVSYPLPLTSPPVLLDFQERLFCEIASESLVEIQMVARDDGGRHQKRAWRASCAGWAMK